jgi:hypothetical protein
MESRKVMRQKVYHVATEQQLIPLHILDVESIDVFLALAKAVKHFACNHCTCVTCVVTDRQVARMRWEECSKSEDEAGEMNLRTCSSSSD